MPRRNPFAKAKSAKGKAKQRSKKVIFKPDLDKTYNTMNLALVEHPYTTKKDWLVADSVIEYKRFCFLLEQLALGKIEDLFFHPPFILLPALRIPPNGLWVKDNQAKIGYTADSSYLIRGAIFVVEDVKGSYSDSPKNIEKGIAGKPIITDAAHLRHKLLVAQLIGEYGANCHFKIVTKPEAPLEEE